MQIFIEICVTFESSVYSDWSDLNSSSRSLIPAPLAIKPRPDFARTCQSQDDQTSVRGLGEEFECPLVIARRRLKGSSAILRPDFCPCLPSADCFDKPLDNLYRGWR